LARIRRWQIPRCIDDLNYIRLIPNFLVSISLYYVLRIIEEQILVIREVRGSDDKLNAVR